MQQPYFDPKADSPLTDAELQAKKNRYDGFDAEQAITQISQYFFKTHPQHFEVLGNTSNAFEHLVYDVLITLPGESEAKHVVYRINTGSVAEEHIVVETDIFTLWSEHGVPAPRIYATTLRNADIPFDVTVMDKIGTDSIEGYRKSHPEEDMMYAEKAGAFLARIHTVPVAGFGNFSLERKGETALRGSNNSWKDALYVNLSETLEYLVIHKILTHEQAQTSKDLIAAHDALLECSQGVTLHGDYHDANILINEHTQEIVGAVDLSQSKVGDPVFDCAFYSTYVTPEKFEQFIKGYFSKAQPISDFEKKMALYQLRIVLSKAKLRKRFGYLERIPAAIEQIEKACQKLTL